MKFPDGSEIIYCVRASVAPWFDNNYVEKKFEVRRSLILKMPHEASYAIEHMVNKCVEHGSILHKKCDPINGHISLEKTAFCHGEDIHVRWELKTEKSVIEHFTCKLAQLIEVRESDPSNYLATRRFFSFLKEQKSTTNSSISLVVPSECLISIPMSLWNVLVVKHHIVLEIKMQKRKQPVVFKYPIIICNEEVAKHKRPREPVPVFKRVQDVDDDSDDDDDYDSEDEEEDPPRRDYSVDIEKLSVTNVTESEQRPLERADVGVTFIMNSAQPQELRSLRLLLTGEVRVGGLWYEFLRFKAIANLSHKTLLSPGEHNFRFQLPFADSQYDTSILPPTLGDEIRYMIHASTESLRKNVFQQRCELLVDRFIDTWAKEAYKPPYTEEYGATNIHLSQRCFKRGKHVIVALQGSEPRYVKGSLVQKKRLRVPNVKLDESYCSQRTVRVVEEEIRRKNHIHVMHIPFNIPPSIEICYWNVLQIDYHYDVEITLEGGHTHNHSIPIWIGCTEDNLLVPTQPDELLPENSLVVDEPYEELPEFEVVHSEDTHEHPYWVERINTDTYYQN
ncbi:hypothetical protein CRE_03255 [Caenorhabditis remanei]|uniref:Arrestin C-terminal-like domain-containing protein n=1 Tax=Caenorhabditis remanei TaxID=31234 RepID=E3MML8_CAERE|nr:hypothetical protein CRE_03255 [Caenorhabditis remanei]